MKKTLKILMAIILFAVVLTIATSVKAADPTPREYKTLAEAVTEEQKEYNADNNYKKIIEEKDGYYQVNSVANYTLTITEETTTNNLKLAVNGPVTFTKGLVINGTAIITTDAKAADAAAFFTNDVQVNGTLKVKNVTMDSLVNKGVVYDNGATFTDYSGDGVVYSTATATLDGTKELTLKDKVKVDAVEYGFVEAPVKDIDKKLDYKVTKIVPENEVDAVNKIEAGKTYVLTITVKYDGKEITAPAVTLAGTTTRELAVNATVDAANMKITVAKEKDLDGNAVNLSASLAGVDGSSKNLAAIAIGTEIKNEEPTQPEQPNNPADTNKPADKGDLDESPKTGDHIIPAATLLAVVVVANVVYFAKSKNN